MERTNLDTSPSFTQLQPLTDDRPRFEGHRLNNDLHPVYTTFRALNAVLT